MPRVWLNTLMNVAETTLSQTFCLSLGYGIGNVQWICTISLELTRVIWFVSKQLPLSDGLHSNIMIIFIPRFLHHLFLIYIWSSPRHSLAKPLHCQFSECERAKLPNKQTEGRTGVGIATDRHVVTDLFRDFCKDSKTPRFNSKTGCI